jgi:hypothetical protein
VQRRIRELLVLTPEGAPAGVLSLAEASRLLLEEP